MLAEGHLLLVLHRLPDPNQDLKREGILFWRTPDGEWKVSDGRSGVGALRTHLETYIHAAEELEADYERAADAVSYFRILEAITPLHRAAVNCHAALQSAREGLPEARELITLRDIAGDVERATELLQADAKNALDYQVARQNEEQARAANESANAGHRLNLLAALFLPLTAVTSIFGMSLPNGLEGAPSWVYWSIVAFGLVLGFVVRGFLR